MLESLPFGYTALPGLTLRRVELSGSIFTRIAGHHRQDSDNWTAEAWDQLRSVHTRQRN